MGLIKLGFFSEIKACWVIGKQFMGPHCLPLLGLCLVLAGLQDGDADQVLGRLTRMAGKEMVCHLTVVPTMEVVGLVVAPPQSHGLLIHLSGGGLTNIVSPGTFRSARLTDQVIDHSRPTRTCSLSRDGNFVSWQGWRGNKSAKIGSFADKTLAACI